MRTFEVFRPNDTTGVSGTGLVVEGVIFSDGTCVTRWVAESSPGRSTSIWDSFGAFSAIHIAPHPDNKTKTVFDDGEVFQHTEKVETTPEVKEVRKRRKKKEVVANGE